jgi:hypothetical protein
MNDNTANGEAIDSAPINKLTVSNDNNERVKRKKAWKRKHKEEEGSRGIQNHKDNAIEKGTAGDPVKELKTSSKEDAQVLNPGVVALGKRRDLGDNWFNDKEIEAKKKKGVGSDQVADDREDPGISGRSEATSQGAAGNLTGAYVSACQEP